MKTFAPSAGPTQAAIQMGNLNLQGEDFPPGRKVTLQSSQLHSQGPGRYIRVTRVRRNDFPQYHSRDFWAERRFCGFVRPASETFQFELNCGPSGEENYQPSLPTILGFCQTLPHPQAFPDLDTWYLLSYRLCSLYLADPTQNPLLRTVQTQHCLLRGGLVLV